MNSYLVETGGLCATKTPATLEPTVEPRTEHYRITSPGPSAAQTAAMQLLAASAARDKAVVSEPWAEASEGAQAG